MKAHRLDFERMIKEQEEIIKSSEEALRQAHLEYEEADGKINGYISRNLPAEPEITPDTLNTDVIGKHIQGDENIMSLMNMESDTVVRSLCALLNVIKQEEKRKQDEKGSSEEEISDMELDEKEGPGTQTEKEPRRKPRRKAPAGEMDVTTAEAGKRVVEESTESNPPAKVIATVGATEQHAKAPPALPPAKKE